MTLQPDNTYMEITALSDYVDFATKYIQQPSQQRGEKQPILFRGQNEDRQLLPSIARASEEGRIQFREEEMFSCFQLEAIRFLKHKPDNRWEWLAVAQHYGLPTRLLDWTKNPLVALWFTVEKKHKQNSQPGVVWMYQPDESNTVNDVTKENPFDVHHTKVYDPKHLIPRIHSQDGVFTVSKYNRTANRFVALQADQMEEDKFIKILVRAERFGDIRNQLSIIGINSAKLFPDLDGLTKRIADDHIIEND